MTISASKGFILVLVVSALSACSSVNTSAPATSTTEVATKTRTKLLPDSPTRPVIQTAWWQRFNDPLMTTLIQEAWQANPTLQTAQASVQAARAQGVIAGASLLPTVSASGSLRDTNSARLSGSLSVDASWELDLWGGNRLASVAAQHDFQAAQANYQDVKATLAAEVASAYVNLRLAQARAGLARKTHQSRQETLKLAEMRLKAGLDSGLTTEQARLSYGQNQAQLPELDSAVQRSQYALSVLTGKTPSALVERLSTPKPIPSVRGVLQTTIPANAMRQRPDIRAAEYQIAAASARVGEAKTNLYPSFNLAGSLTNSGFNLGDLLDPTTIAKNLLASISAPLFNGGKLKQQVIVKDAAYDQAVANYQKTILSALQDVANGFATLQALQKQQPILQQNLTTGRSTERLATMSYQAGLSDFQNVLEAQRSVLSTQEALLSAQAETSLALISLYKAVGGAW